MNLNNNYNVYLLDINPDNKEEAGVFAVSLVHNPAIKKNFQAFNNAQRFTASDNQKKIISGAVMIPNELILRKAEDGTPYYVTFTPDSIYRIMQEFFKNQYNNSVTLDHKTATNGLYMFESLYIDKNRGINAPVGYGNLEDGTWFASYKVEDDIIWNEFISTGIFRGFSVEGLFKHIPIKLKNQKDELFNDIINLIDDMIANGTNNK